MQKIVNRDEFWYAEAFVDADYEFELNIQKFG